jgi:glyoxylase-like metal-dependent hydrolase (beta-lactamase superfamily II)
MSNGIKLCKIYHAGYCVGRGVFAQRTLGWSKVRFHARSFLLEHPTRGLILIDTGYGKAFMKSMRKGINRLYHLFLPVNFESKDSVLEQLAKDGIAMKDLSYLCLSHFHPDHIGALSEFGNTPWIYRQRPLEMLQKLSRWKRLCNICLSDLPPPPPHSFGVLESNFQNESSLWPHENQSFPFFDLFQDGSFFLVDLPGHALGQMGVLTKTHFFVADAMWSLEALPHPLGIWIQENSKDYRDTFEKLQKMRSSIEIIPSHTIEPYV